MNHLADWSFDLYKKTVGMKFIPRLAGMDCKALGYEAVALV